MSNEQIFVSVVIPTYNRERAIRTCLDKLAESTLDLSLMEVVAVDDHSSDETVNVLEEYQTVFPNFKLKVLEENSGGASLPRNEGMKLATGRFIFFLDSDDWLTPHALADAYELAQKDPTIDMICMPYFQQEGGKRAISRSSFNNPETISGVKFAETKLYNTLNAVGKMILRSLVEKYQLDFPAGIKVREDNWFMMKAYGVVKNIGILGNAKQYYFIDAKDEMSLSQHGTPPRDAVKIYQSAFDFIWQQPDISPEDQSDLLAIFFNRYARMIERGEYAPIRLIQHIQKAVPTMLQNRFLTEEAKAYLEKLAKENGVATLPPDPQKNPLLTAGVIGDPHPKQAAAEVTEPEETPSVMGNRYDKEAVFPELHAYDPCALAFNENHLLTPRPEGYRVSHWGTGHLLLYLAILDDLQEGKLKPQQEVTFSKRAASVGAGLRGTRGKEGEKRYLQELLNQAISLNAPDCILALCTLYGGVEGAMKRIHQVGDKLHVSRSSRLIATGRLAKKQSTNIYDYYKIGLGFLKLARGSFTYITNRTHVIGGRFYRPQSMLDLKGTTIASIYWGTANNECLLFREVDGKLCCSVAINGRHYIHGTEMALMALEPQADVAPAVVQLQSPTVNFLADTYLGELYTEWRKIKQTDDALQKYGYDYTLEKLAEKIHEDDYSVVTFEGVLVQPEEESRNKRKVYYLGGVKEPNIRELQNRRFNLVNFANNHAKDYDTRALLDSIDSLREVGMETLGAGVNLSEATRPVILRYQGREAALFSGYWYRLGKDLNFDFYATNRDGVASLQGVLLDRIKAFKKDHPDTKVIVIPHWGSDFEDVMEEQTQVAKMLVAAGADLIIGSGPHKIQPIVDIDGVTTFYSVGNGAFNSNGWGLKLEGNLPYGYFLKWDILADTAQVYPFNNYNPETFWQPHYYDQAAAATVDQDLQELNQGKFLTEVQFDEAGHLYYEMPTGSRRQVQPVKGWAQWFRKNLRGHFLNPAISEEIQLDYATSNLNRLVTYPQYQKALYVALNTENLKGLASKVKWQPAHGNMALLRSQVMDQVAMVLTDVPIEELKDTIPQYIVEDSLQASMILAGYLAENYQGDSVAITGSAGKTSTRNMLTSLLKDKQPITNFENSNLKVPSYDLSLNLLADKPAAIFEAAASGFNGSMFGNMAYVWENDVVVFTSFGTAHAITGVQRNLEVKAGIFLGLKNGGTAVINGDMEERYLWKVLDYARQQNANIRLTSLTHENAYCHLVSKEVGRSATKIQVKLGEQYVDFSLTVDSDGQIRNAMAALVTLEALGYDIFDYTEGLATFENYDRIFQQIEVRNDKGHYTLIDDTYNSSILALENGIQTFLEKQHFFAGNKILVIGETADLGNMSESEHLKLLPLLKQCQDARILLQGAGLKQVADQLENAAYYEAKDEMLQNLAQHVNEDALIFVKGSSLGQFKTVADQIKAGDFS